MVRSKAGSIVDGMTTGKAAPKIDAVAQRTNAPVAPNAMPSEPAFAARHAIPTATAAAATRTHVHGFPLRNCTATIQPSMGRTANGSNRTNQLRARCRTSPSVFNARNARAWTSAKATTPNPPSRACQLNQDSGPPLLSPLASIGRPVVVNARAAPMPKAATKDPMAIAQSQLLRHFSVSTFPRYSKATARKINATSTRRSGT